MIIIIIAVIGMFYPKWSTWFESKPTLPKSEITEISPHIKGSKDAKYTLVEFSDFQCPACANAIPFITEILQRYPEQVNIEYRHLPLDSIHPNARAAAFATESAGFQGKFWEMHDILFERQAVWSSKVNPQPTFLQFAQEIGLDIEQFRADLDHPVITTLLEQHEGEARRANITGTPTFFLISDESKELNITINSLQALAEAIE